MILFFYFHLYKAVVPEPLSYPQPAQIFDVVQGHLMQSIKPLFGYIRCPRGGPLQIPALAKGTRGEVWGLLIYGVCVFCFFPAPSV